MLSQQTDTEVYAALKEGNSQALAVLYDRYGDVVYRLCLRMLTNTQEAEDLTQEVFLILWRQQNYDPRRGSLLAFFSTLTRSRAIDRHRRSQAQWRMQERWGRNQTSEDRRELMDKLALNEMSDRVRQAIAELPEKQKTVLEMAYFDGLSQSEIAAGLQIPLGTVKTHKRNALLKLRKILNNLVEE
ncbi:sigma-70 family RNA polymerase sigma factor [Synechocystis salina LEGE 06155]|nr:sigma-70 family RNA polymerase sigma factor [Synechocystis salina LEGE 06155]